MRSTLAFSLVCLFLSLTFGCAVSSHGTADSFHRPLHMDNTPPELHATAVAMDWLVPAGIIGAGLGVALLVWMPVEETTGLAIAAGSLVCILGAVLTRFTIAHPIVLIGLTGTTLAGLGWFSYKHFFSTPPPTPMPPVA